MSQPAPERPICYEHPLNERIRSLLRLEFLFQQFRHSAAGTSEWDGRTALLSLVEIIDLASRSELKSELARELERQAIALNRLKHSHGVNIDTLESVLDTTGRVLGMVRGIEISALEAVRQNDFLSAFRQRSNIPGGTCRFDLPALHLWLQHPTDIRRQQLAQWLQPLRSVQESVELLLGMIRASAEPQTNWAHQGFFEKSLDGNAPNQLLRVLLAPGLTVYPEISGSKHRFAVRFLSQPDPNQRANKIADDIEFLLACCAI